MGLSGSKNPKSQGDQISGKYDLDVYILPQQDLSLSHPSLQPHSWNSLQFTHTSFSITVSKENINLGTIQLDENFEITNEQQDILIFTIKFYSDNQGVKRWKIRCKSNDEYRSWTKYLKKSRRKIWFNSKKCQRCSKAFNLFTRKHHCRKCGECICDDCSPIRSTLPELAYKEMVRICVKCGRDIETCRKGKSLSSTPNFKDQRKGNF